jgi:DNA-directed RNA polymerase specialized sigma24 family protein
MDIPEFSEFFAVLQSRDGQAVEEMLRDVAPFLRRAIRLRLIDGRLRRTVDTTDILQSLLNDFLARDTSGTRPTAQPGGLCAYLAAAVRNKIVRKAHRERHHAGGLPPGWEPPGPESGGLRRVEDEDFHQAVRSRLSEAERRLFDLKALGLTWPEIAARVGGQPDALRMRLTRAVVALLTTLGHGELSHAR